MWGPKSKYLLRVSEEYGRIHIQRIGFSVVSEYTGSCGRNAKKVFHLVPVPTTTSSEKQNPWGRLDIRTGKFYHTIH